MTHSGILSYESPVQPNQRLSQVSNSLSKNVIWFDGFHHFKCSIRVSNIDIAGLVIFGQSQASNMFISFGIDMETIKTVHRK